GDEPSRLPVGGEPGPFLLHHVRASRAGDDDLSPVPHGGAERPDVVVDLPPGLLDASAVQVGHAAAPLRRPAHVHAVPAEDPHGGAPGGGRVVLDLAGGEEGHPTGGSGGGGAGGGRMGAPPAEARPGGGRPA